MESDNQGRRLATEIEEQRGARLRMENNANLSRRLAIDQREARRVPNNVRLATEAEEQRRIRLVGASLVIPT